MSKNNNTLSFSILNYKFQCSHVNNELSKQNVSNAENGCCSAVINLKAETVKKNDMGKNTKIILFLACLLGGLLLFYWAAKSEFCLIFSLSALRLQLEEKPVELKPLPDFSNDCLLKNDLGPPTKNAPQTFLEECSKWVIDTTDRIWNLENPNLDVDIPKYFYWNFTSNGAFGKTAVGLKKLREAVDSTKRAFPDLRIHITDVACIGNDIDGYKTIMPDVLIGTNTGPSIYSDVPTNKKITYSGIAVTYVNRNVKGEWQYIAEWILHDEYSILSQLGLLEGDKKVKHSNSKVTLNPNCGVNQPTWGFKAKSPEPVA